MELPNAVGIIGAGTMGAGIAQLFLGAGVPVLLHDASQEQVADAGARIQEGLRRWEERGKIPSAAEAQARLMPCPGLVGMQACDLVIEAIVEDRGAKAEVFR